MPPQAPSKPPPGKCRKSTAAPFRLISNDHLHRPNSQMASPFEQRFGTNYVPTSQELDRLQILIEEENSVIDGIDAEIDELMMKREIHIQRMGEHFALASPVRRLPDDIVLATFLESLALTPPWPSPHPIVAISHVCRWWRELALSAPPLWTKIEVTLPWADMEEKYRNRIREAQSIENLEHYFLQVISLFHPFVERVLERVKAFIQRSRDFPLDLAITARDMARMPPSSRLLNEWTALLDPLCQSIAEPTGVGRWKYINLDLTVSPALPTSLRFLQILPASSSLGVSSITLGLRTVSGNVSIPEALWNDILPTGTIDLRSADLRVLVMKMSYPYIRRIEAPWDRLTTLTIGPAQSVLLPEDIHSVLRLTRNLIYCTISFPFPVPRQHPHLTPVTLAALESLTVNGYLPPCTFAQALDLPSLTRLYAVDAEALPERETTTFSVLLWIQRHGTQLKEVSLSDSYLAKSSFRIALENLPNVESVSLAWSPASDMGTSSCGVAELLGELATANISGLCPKLRTLPCSIFSARSGEIARAIVDFITECRSVSRPSSMVPVVEISVVFTLPPAWNIMEELVNRGVDTEGVSIRCPLYEIGYSC